MANMLEQAPGMLGMAFMFVVTILLGIWLQPFFDAAGLHAFGESGTSQGRWVLLELIAIFLFTFLILWLAKNNLQKFIKYGLLCVLFLAMCYTTVPGAHMLLVPDVETEEFAFTNESVIGEELVAIMDDGSMITQIVQWDDNGNNDTFVITKRSDFASQPVWSHTLDAYPGEPTFTVVEGIYAYTVTNSQWIWSIDKDSGEILSKYACFPTENWDGESLPEEPLDNLVGGCIAVLEVIADPDEVNEPRKGSLFILNFDGEITERATFHGTNTTTLGQSWKYPQLMPNEGTMEMKQTTEDNFMIVTKMGAISIVLGESNPESEVADPTAPLTREVLMDWYVLNEQDDEFTSFTIGQNPWNESSEIMLIGRASGEIMAYEKVGNEVSDEERFHGNNAFNGPITTVSVQDLNSNEVVEIWVADADGVHGLFGTKLVEYVTFSDIFSNGTYLFIDDLTITSLSVGGLEEARWSHDNISMVIESGEFKPETMYNSYGIQLSDMALIVGVSISIVLMAALIIRPEWYVVNTVGVLVGGGVIVMLGVTFVPTLIVIFMILAAVYDAWAVYRSKHMLDLADTMIGLNLPILLVAPQDKGYSMLDQQDSIRPVESSAEAKPAPSTTQAPKKRKKSKEAMFMGLGDVIFPGMLVVSCVQWIDSGLEVGISTLIGGLIGYLVLMGYVASGRPQAGLPLLNGGAILGYIVGGLVFVGSAAFSFGISF